MIRCATLIGVLAGLEFQRLTRVRVLIVHSRARIALNSASAGRRYITSYITSGTRSIDSKDTAR